MMAWGELEHPGAPRLDELAVAVENHDGMVGVAVEAIDPILVVAEHGGGGHRYAVGQLRPVAVKLISVRAVADDVGRSSHQSLLVKSIPIVIRIKPHCHSERSEESRCESADFSHRIPQPRSAYRIRPMLGKPLHRQRGGLLPYNKAASER